MNLLTYETICCQSEMLEALSAKSFYNLGNWSLFSRKWIFMSCKNRPSISRQREFESTNTWSRLGRASSTPTRRLDRCIGRWLDANSTKASKQQSIKALSQVSGARVTKSGRDARSGRALALAASHRQTERAFTNLSNPRLLRGVRLFSSEFLGAELSQK